MTAAIGGDGLCELELGDGDVREADVPDETLLLERGERGDLLLERRVRGLPAMQVVEVDAAHAEPSGAQVAL